MKREFLTLSIALWGIIGVSAQNSYEVTNSVVLKNVNCQLTKTSLILPVPQSNNYQTISNLKDSGGDILDAVDSSNKYLREIKEMDMPAPGESYALSESFIVTLYPMRIDMSQFEMIYPYDTNSEIYKRYTVDKGEYIDTDNPDIKRISERLWAETQGNIIDYAESCYEYVAQNYRYLNPNTGIHPIAKILSDGGGDCGNLALIYVNLLRAKQIPAKHIVTVRPDGSYHVWTDFYLERYGWIPVDVNMKLDNPAGNYFGYCRGDGIVMSEDICFDVEFVPGELYDVIILQNYYWWYWCSSGDRIETSHLVDSKSLTGTNVLSISNIEADNVTLDFDWISGADYYKVNLYENDKDLVKSVGDIPVGEKSLILNDLTPNTEYTVEIIPLRFVGSVETQMNNYAFQFKTAENIGTAIESISRKDWTIVASKGQVSFQLFDAVRVSIFTMAGECVYGAKVGTGTSNISVPEAILIVKIVDNEGEVFTEKVNCM